MNIIADSAGLYHLVSTVLKKYNFVKPINSCSYVFCMACNQQYFHIIFLSCYVIMLFSYTLYGIELHEASLSAWLKLGTSLKFDVRIDIK